jgi:purine-binding chemotaxis protein CheW
VAGTQQYSSFVVDDLLVGIKVEDVQEVTTGSALTPVPQASPLVSGLLNLRGRIVTAIDLRRCLELGDRPADQRPVHVIIRTDDGGVSLLVDQVGDVLQVDEDDFEAAPSTLRGRLRELITGAYKLDGRLLLALDTNAALACSTSEQT